MAPNRYHCFQGTDPTQHRVFLYIYSVCVCVCVCVKPLSLTDIFFKKYFIYLFGCAESQLRHAVSF